MGKRGPAKGTGGRPRKSIDDKLVEGKTASVINKPNVPAEPGYPAPSDFLSREQRFEYPLKAKEVYTRVYEWLRQYGCDKLVIKESVEFYAICTARWVQCEEAVSRAGFTGKHPTTSMPIASPFVAMSREYLKQAHACWDRIYSVVRENASGTYDADAPNVDMMELLLAGKL